MVARINADMEEYFREALSHAAKAEIEEMEQTLQAADGPQWLIESLELCRITVSYAVIDVCGRSWPNEDNRRRIAKSAATNDELARSTGLTIQQAYDYITRVCLKIEPIHKVFPDPEESVKVAFLTTAGILVSYFPKGMNWWEWLDQIEKYIELAWAADLDVLPALMVRARQELVEAKRAQDSAKGSS